MVGTEQRIRKQVYLLTAEDLAEYPIWEFCSDEEGEDGQDEATVRPSTDREVQGYSPGIYIVAADAVFSDGTAAAGYVYSGEPQDFGCTQPNVLIGSQQINLWLGSLRFQSNVNERLAGFYGTLGKNREAVFPITFDTRAKVNGSAMRIVVESFMGMDDKRKTVVLG